MNEDNFIRRVREAVPETEPFLAEHLAYNEELLLHVFVARVRGLAIDAFNRGDRDLSDRIVDVFDSGLQVGDERVENAAAVSFVEDTPWWDPARKGFIASWPLALDRKSVV
jgi:hypothetical protein